mmetsp:Transcript_48678/g.141964  ORF Transcript_48678/g.141964 Transcript_48678/m.141964 type:complete len:210 (-) Transcript_48678:722-1351(-)
MRWRRPCTRTSFGRWRLSATGPYPPCMIGRRSAAPSTWSMGTSGWSARRWSPCGRRSEPGVARRGRGISSSPCIPRKSAAGRAPRSCAARETRHQESVDSKSRLVKPRIALLSYLELSRTKCGPCKSPTKPRYAQFPPASTRRRSPAWSGRRSFPARRRRARASSHSRPCSCSSADWRRTRAPTCSSTRSPSFCRRGPTLASSSLVRAT